MPTRSQRTERLGTLAIGRAARAVATTLDASTKARCSTLALFAVLAYLAIGRSIRPGFTEYWWYQLVQTSATLAVLVTLETAFARQGGLAWQTHLIIGVTTYADVLGTAGNLYDDFGPYDKIVHFWSGAAVAAVAYEVMRLLDRRGALSVSSQTRAVLAVVASFSIAGILWELYEYSSDAIFNSGRVQSRLDTTHDLMSNVCGATLAVVVLGAREVARARFGRRVTT